MRLISSIILCITTSFSLYSMRLFKPANSKRAPNYQEEEALVSTNRVHSTTTQEVPLQVPVIPTYNNQVATPQNITVNVQLQNANTNTVQVEQTVYTQVWQTTRTHIQQAFDQLKQYSMLHKKKLVACALIACHAGIQSTIWYLQHTLQNKQWWSFWQQEKSLQELYTINQNKLTHELLSTLQTRYTTAHNPLDYATPLVLFAREIEQENTLLTRYKKIISILERLKLSTLFFYKRQLIPEYTERLNRLTYIKNCFFNSLIEHKVSHIQTIQIPK